MNLMTWLKSLRLSLIQWGLLTVAAAVGWFVVAYRIQGGELHRAQIALLLATIRQSDTGKEVAVTRARERFNQAMKEYSDAQKKS